VAALVVLVLLLLAGYGALARIWPYRACRRCTGSGKRRAPGGRTWRSCTRCGATGQRLRFAARAARRR
jgi:hypothetical protein